MIRIMYKGTYSMTDSSKYIQCKAIFNARQYESCDEVTFKISQCNIRVSSSIFLRLAE